MHLLLDLHLQIPAVHHEAALAATLAGGAMPHPQLAEILSQLEHSLTQEYGERLSQVILFGSQAKAKPQGYASVKKTDKKTKGNGSRKNKEAVSARKKDGSNVRLDTVYSGSENLIDM